MVQNTNYKHKYLKYKLKYKKICNQNGGMEDSTQNIELMKIEQQLKNNYEEASKIKERKNKLEDAEDYDQAKELLQELQNLKKNKEKLLEQKKKIYSEAAINIQSFLKTLNSNKIYNEQKKLFKVIKNKKGEEITVGPNTKLSSVDLRGIDLSGIDFSGADLENAYLYDADLSGANLSDANLEGADLSDANLTGAKLIDANLKVCILDGANLENANLSGADLQHAALTYVRINADTKLGNCNDTVVSLDKSDKWINTDTSYNLLDITKSNKYQMQGNKWNDDNYSIFINHLSDIIWTNLYISSINNDIFNNESNQDIFIGGNIEINNIEFKNISFQYLNREEFPQETEYYYEEYDDYYVYENRFENCNFYNCNFNSGYQKTVIFKNCTFINSNIEVEHCRFIFINNTFKDGNLEIESSEYIIYSNNFLKANLIGKYLEIENSFFGDNIFNDVPIDDTVLEHNDDIYEFNISSEKAFNDEITDIEAIIEILKHIIEIITSNSTLIETLLSNKNVSNLEDKLIQNFKTIKSLIPFEIIKVCFTNKEINTYCNKYILQNNISSGMLKKLKEMDVNLKYDDFDKILNNTLPVFHYLFIEKRKNKETEWKGIKTLDLFKIFFSYFKGIDLSNKDLSNLDLKKQDLRDVNFSGANLTNTDLRGANLEGVKFTDAILNGTIFPKSYTHRLVVNSKGEEILISEFGDTNLYGTDLSGANLNGLDLSGFDLQNCNLSNAKLINVDFGAGLFNTNLYGANLYGANLEDTEIGNTNFEDANLYDAIISFACTDERIENFFDGAEFSRKTKILNSDYKLIYNGDIDHNIPNDNLKLIGPGVTYKSDKIKIGTVDKYDSSKVINLSEQGISNLEYCKFLGAERGNIKYMNNFANLNFENVALDFIEFKNSNLNGSNFSGAIFNYDYYDIKFSYCNMANVIFGNSKIRFDYYNIEFSYCNMTNVDFGNSKIHSAKFIDCNLLNSDLSKVYVRDIEIKCSITQLKNTIFSRNLLYLLYELAEDKKDCLIMRDNENFKISLINSDLNLVGADFSEIDLTNKDLSKLDLSYANFRKSNLSNVNLSNSNIENSILHSFKGTPTNLDQKYIFKKGYYYKYDRYGDGYNIKNETNIILNNQNNNYNNSELFNLDLSEISLNYCDFSNSNLRFCNFSNTSFYKTNLENSIIKDCILSNVDLRNCNLKNAKIYDILINPPEHLLPIISDEYILKKYNSLQRIHTTRDPYYDYGGGGFLDHEKYYEDDDDYIRSGYKEYNYVGKGVYSDIKYVYGCILHKSINDKNFTNFDSGPYRITINYSELYIDFLELNEDDIILLKEQNINFVEEIQNFIENKNNFDYDRFISIIKTLNIDFNELLFTAQKKRLSKTIEFIRKNDSADEKSRKIKLISYLKNKYITENSYSNSKEQLLDFIEKNDNSDFDINYNYNSIFDLEDIAKIILYNPYLALILYNSNIIFKIASIYVPTNKRRYHDYQELEVLKFYIKNDKNIDKKDPYENTPLQIALAEPHIRTAELLIEAGANVNNENNEGNTPLHIIAENAFSNGDLDIIELLIKKGADINKKNKKGQLPLELVNDYKYEYDEDGEVIETKHNKYYEDAKRLLSGKKKRSSALSPRSAHFLYGKRGDLPPYDLHIE